MKEGNKLIGTTLNELNEKYKSCPMHTSKYLIDKKEYIVHSHFCGNKDIDKVINSIAMNRAMYEVFEESKNIA